MSEDCPHCLYDKTHENCPGCWEGSHYRPKPSAPRRIHSPVDHYDVDVSTGTVTYHVVRTNGDRIRSMSDEELAEFIGKFCDCQFGDCPITTSPYNCSENGCNGSWLKWLKKEGDRMSVSKWAYSPLMCDGIVCAGDCDYCGNRERAEAFKTLQTDFEVCRNELCLRCGDYKMAHKGACDDCRWRH